MAGRPLRTFSLSLPSLLFCACSGLTEPHDEVVTAMPEPVASVVQALPDAAVPIPTQAPPPAPPPVFASHILIAYKGAKGTTAKVPNRSKAQAQKLAEDVAKRAATGDFAKLAKQFSEDTVTSARGGDLGELTPTRVPKAVYDAAHSLAPGAVSAPIDAEDGFHIVRSGPSAPAAVAPTAPAKPKPKVTPPH